LWCFNEEVVVCALADSAIPVISAVGHETDTTLADHAADRRAPTPTAAAEIAVPVRRELQAAIDELGLRQRKCALRPVDLGRERLHARVARLPRPEALAAQAAQKLDELAERLRRGLADRAARARERLQGDSAQLSAPLLRERVRSAQRHLASVRLQSSLLTAPLAQRRERLAAIARLAEQLHPERPLQRGYVMVLDHTGKAVADAARAAREAALTLKFRDGLLDVVPATATPAPPRKSPAPVPPPDRQPKLL
jgi:exodeoxyribonuclease VII large subunit